MTPVWRIVQRRYVDSAFSGEGSAKYGGRWIHKRTAVVYASQSESLAQLEILVRTSRPGGLASYVLIEAQIPETLIETLEAGELPGDWRQSPEPNSTKNIGTKWVAEGRSAVLAVPSVVVPSELNYILNPAHPDFIKIKIGKPKAIDWDERLINLLGPR
ncbi:MAG: RES domain-containing protein [Verrucomicrobia bacterium]|nr:RES domain-containing protein [Verrucomicrobiota bacterium]